MRTSSPGNQVDGSATSNVTVLILRPRFAGKESNPYHVLNFHSLLWCVLHTRLELEAESSSRLIRVACCDSDIPQWVRELAPILGGGLLAEGDQAMPLCTLEVGTPGQRISLWNSFAFEHQLPPDRFAQTFARNVVAGFGIRYREQGAGNVLLLLRSGNRRLADSSSRSVNEIVKALCARNLPVDVAVFDESTPLRVQVPPCPLVRSHRSLPATCQSYIPVYMQASFRWPFLLVRP